MAVARHLELLAMPGVVWFHVPNGGLRNNREAGRFRMMGVKAGVPDIIALKAGVLYALELKTTTGRPSAEQTAMMIAMSAAGAECAIAHGLDAALGTLDAWGLLKGYRPSNRMVS